MKRLKGVSFDELNAETIKNSYCGNELTPTCGSYGAHTIRTVSGREFVLWNALGEVNLSEVIKT